MLDSRTALAAYEEREERFYLLSSILNWLPLDCYQNWFSIKERTGEHLVDRCLTETGLTESEVGVERGLSQIGQ